MFLETDIVISGTEKQGGLPVGLLSGFPSEEGHTRWYAVHAPEGQEKTTAEKCRLLFKGSLLKNCFVPQCEKYYKCRGVWRIVTVPLFEGYFFISTDDIRGFSQALKKLSFPASLVGKQKNSYIPLSQNIQVWLGSALDDSYILRASEGVIENRVLKVNCGPLRGYETYIHKIDRHKRMAWIGLGDTDNSFNLRVALNVYEKN